MAPLAREHATVKRNGIVRCIFEQRVFVEKQAARHHQAAILGLAYNKQ